MPGHVHKSVFQTLSAFAVQEGSSPERTVLLLMSNDQLLVWAELVDPADLRQPLEPLQLAPPQERLMALIPPAPPAAQLTYQGQSQAAEARPPS